MKKTSGVLILLIALTIAFCANAQTLKTYWVDSRNEGFKQADSLYFSVPSIFYVSTEAGWLVKQLEMQFAAGAITTEEFVAELNHKAEMIEMEDI